MMQNETTSSCPLLRTLDPRARLVVGLLLLLQLVLLPVGIGLLIAAILLGMFLIAGRPPLKRLGVALIAVAWMLILALLLHGFTTPGHIIWTVPVVDWNLTSEGLAAGTLIAARLMALVLIGVTLSLALSTLEAIQSLDVLLSPLARLRVPVGSFSLLLAMSLRFVPTLYSEALQLRKALRARGWSPGRKLLDRVRAWIPLFIPLIASSLRRADDLAETLVLRGWRPHAARSVHGLTEWHARDTIAVAAVSLPFLIHAIQLIFIAWQ